MARRKGFRCPWALTVVCLGACASVDPGPDYERARNEIEATTGEVEVHDPSRPVLSDEEIEVVLLDGLGLAEATRLALLNNRRLQAGFLGLGVARSDYVQAGLLRNPSLSLAFLFPDIGGRVKWTADLVGNVTDIWQIPSRQAVARAGLEQRILDLSRLAGELVASTRSAYYESVAAREARAVARENLELARRSLEGVRRQVEGGVASKTDEGIAESLALGADLAYQRSEREEATAMRRLAALLSIQGEMSSVILTDPLPEPAWPGIEREDLVEASLPVRPDLRAAERAVAAAEERVRLERRRRFPEVDAAVSTERPEGGNPIDFLAGPGAAVEIPIFDRNQAQLSRAEFELGERRKEYEARLAEASQEVRAAVDRAEIAARAASFAKDELRPQAERSLSLAGKAYELGDTTVLTLLQAEKAALEARRTEIEALLEAALSLVEVERAAGAPLAASAPSDE